MCYDFYTGPFTNITWFDLSEAVEGSTIAWYGRALPVPVGVRPSRAWLCGILDLGIFVTWLRGILDLRILATWLCGILDLGILATHKSSLISLNLAQKVSKSAK
jgi:hypothetical protein